MIESGTCAPPTLKQTDEVKFGKPGRTAVKLLLYYMLFAPLVAMPFYNTVIFHPFMCGDYGRKTVCGLPVRNIDFKNSSGDRLHGWFIEKPGASKVILVSHGNAGNLTHRLPLAQLLLQTNSSVFLYDYRGYGLSSGSATLDGVCDDGLAAYDCLTGTLKANPSQVFVYGESLGSGVSCHIAQHRHCAGIILQSGFMSVNHLAGTKIALFRLYPRCLYPANCLENDIFLSGRHAPLLLLHGRDDTIIPVTESRLLFAAASQPKRLIEVKGGHNDICSSELLQPVASFVQSQPMAMGIGPKPCTQDESR